MGDTHYLKTWPEYFAAIEAGRKTFEVRRGDRDFAVGDVLVLEEYDPATQKYSGRIAVVCVTYVFRGDSDPFGAVSPGFVVMGIRLESEGNE